METNPGKVREFGQSRKVGTMILVQVFPCSSYAPKNVIAQQAQNNNTQVIKQEHKCHMF